jgi:hypothetical protein
MAARRLINDIKVMIVTQLACFTAPAAVRDMVEKEYGFAPPLTTVLYYDVTTAGSQVAPRWRKLFEKTRETYLAEVSRVPIMHKAYRMWQLQKLLEKEWERSNLVAVLAVLKQAAEEEGGVFTNRRELTGAGGKDLPAAALRVEFVQAAGRDTTR